MRFLPANFDAILIELDDLTQTLALLDSLREKPISGVDIIVPAARTLLVNYQPSMLSQSELIAHVGSRSLVAPVERHRPLVEIPVDYQGEDLVEVAHTLGLSTAEVIKRHSGCEYSVAFTGFAPGFAYLSGGDPSLNVPRRDTPRTRIPAGAVGLAGLFSGVYPKASPGGWQIIGTTRTSMWDLERVEPALLQPGFRVRFVDVTGQLPAAVPPPHAVTPATSIRHDGPALVVKQISLPVLFQDTGRGGLAAQGVSRSGAMDVGALRAANRLVGNPSDSACLEIVAGGFKFASQGDTVVAITGADVPIRFNADADADAGVGLTCEQRGYQAIALSDGDCLDIGAPRAGTHNYLAVRGGFTVAPVLGSHSTDTLAGIGPPHVITGDVLPVWPLTRGGIVGSPETWRDDFPKADSVVTLDIVLGPRTDWFTAEAVALLVGQPWKVTPQSNRIGLRLSGELPLKRAKLCELPSEGTLFGAIQVPPNGQPVLFMADHPLTGGYPVIGAVVPYHLGLASQIPIGAAIRFNPVQAFFANTI